MVVTDLDGKVLEGELRPSPDLPTHLALYRAFGAIGGVVQAHAHYATAWAQAGRQIPCLGTTHATMTVLEAAARLARDTLALNAGAKPIVVALHDKHYGRKHGMDACNEQRK